MNPTFIEDNTADLDLEPNARGNKAGNTSNKTNKISNQLTPYKLGMHFPPI